MYKLIGDDKKEYGPVSAEQLRQWIAQGRANANTLVQADGSTEWKPLSQFSEFASAFTQDAASPSPQIDSMDSEKLANEILTRDYQLNIGNCFDRAWTLLKSDFWPMIGVSALILLIFNAIGILAGPFLGGLFRYYLKKIRGERAVLEDAFSGCTLAFLPLFLGLLIASLLTGFGFALFILPGVYLLVAWKFTLPLIIDKRIDFWPAMELSRKVISKHWWSFLGFVIVIWFVNLAGLLACCVGWFITMPLTMIALAYAYEDIFRTPITPPAQSI